ncbi:MAG: HAMP domain-containing protein [Thermomicrobiales bacterium]|nr:HAMP domain-containing protein [Thermomicrobiales bacterium]
MQTTTTNMPSTAIGDESRASLVRVLARRVSGLSIVYKVLIANVTIVVIGAIAGTWITIITVRRETDQRFYPLAGIFVLVGIVLSLALNFLALQTAFRPLARLQRAALAVRQGDFTVRADESAFGDPEIRELAETLNGTLDELARDRIVLNHLASQVIRAQEDERRRIARELHDDTAQVLFAQLLRLSALKASDDVAVQELAGSLEEMTSEALESVRRLALELRPPALDDLGLLAALGDLAQRFSDQLAIPVDYQARGDRGRLNPDIELVLYRVAQEALTNVAKHASAAAAWVDLDRSETDVTLSIRDNGVGFDEANVVGSDDLGLGLGLFGMEERVSLVGGRFDIWSQPGKGTEVFAYIPLSAHPSPRRTAAAANA